MADNPADIPQSSSYSAHSAYLECARSYQLSRVERIKRRPGAWFPGGSAVHSTIERYLREQLAEEGEGS